MLGQLSNKVTSFKYFDVFLEVVIILGVIDDPLFDWFVKYLFNFNEEQTDFKKILIRLPYPNWKSERKTAFITLI